MSQHPSLRSNEKGAQHRSVLKRYERVRELKEKGKWKDGDSVFGLLKLKILKFKIKKEKAVPAAEEAAALPGAPAAAPGATAKPQPEVKAGAKETPPKKEEGKKEEKKK